MAAGVPFLVAISTQVDTTTAAGLLVFGIFAALAEFERELIRERTVAELEAERARGRKGGGSRIGQFYGTRFNSMRLCERHPV